MDAVELIEPRRDLEPSHDAFVAEFRASGEELVPWVIGEPYSSFDEYVAKLKDAIVAISSRSTSAGFVERQAGLRQGQCGIAPDDSPQRWRVR